MVEGAFGEPRIGKDGQAADPFLAAATLWASLHGLVTLQVTRLAFPWPPLADMIARIAAL
jgi:hypothetical protein